MIFVTYDYKIIGHKIILPKVITVNSFEELFNDSYDSIIKLDCKNCNLNSLPNLPCKLDYLDCSFNNLKELKNIPKSLITLNCNNNQLTFLPTLPNTLKSLYVKHNNITYINSFPPNLRLIDCGYNSLKYLPTLPNTIIYLYCSDNKLLDIPFIPTSLRYIFYSDTPIFDFINAYFDGWRDAYFKWKHTYNTKFANKLCDWFLECKYNPKYKYCRDRVNAEYDKLIC